MAGLLSDVGNFVEAGMKGLMDLAEGYISPHSDAEIEGGSDLSISPPVRPEARPIPIPQSTISSPMVLDRPQGALLQTTDVPSGWIHLQSTYLDGCGGQRKVRSFGLKNLINEFVNVELGSDLGGQLVFWQADDDKREWASGGFQS
jgi:hypothetical protein